MPQLAVTDEHVGLIMLSLCHFGQNVTWLCCARQNLEPHWSLSCQTFISRCCRTDQVNLGRIQTSLALQTSQI